MKKLNEIPIVTQQGQAVIELTLALILVLFVLFSGIKICLSLQKLFKHDFVDRPAHDPDFQLTFSKNLIFFKNTKERMQFKESHDQEKILTFKKLGVIL